MSASATGLSCRQRSVRGKRTANAAFVARAARNAFKAQLEDLRGLHAAHRAKALARGLADDGVHLRNLGVRQARVRLGKGHQLPVGVVGRSPFHTAKV